MQLTNLGYQQLVVGPDGTHSTIANAIAAAPRFGLAEDEAREIAEQVQNAVAQWPEVLGMLNADQALHQRVDAVLKARLRDAAIN
jgi:hypothetical protein